VANDRFDLGLTCVLANTSGSGSPGWLAVGSITGFALGFAPGFGDVWIRPDTNAQVATPVETFHSDHRSALVVMFTVGLMFGSVFGLAITLAISLAAGVAVALGVALVMALVGSRIGIPALQLIAAELILGLCGKRVRFLPFLQTALTGRCCARPDPCTSSVTPLCRTC
jgi:hypothetical protein